MCIGAVGALFTFLREPVTSNEIGAKKVARSGVSILLKRKEEKRRLPVERTKNRSSFGRLVPFPSSSPLAVVSGSMLLICFKGKDANLFDVRSRPVCRILWVLVPLVFGVDFGGLQFLSQGKDSRTAARAGRQGVVKAVARATNTEEQRGRHN